VFVLLAIIAAAFVGFVVLAVAVSVAATLALLGVAYAAGRVFAGLVGALFALGQAQRR
jgi:hypothetical protein